jgi:hypothetical protein
MPVLYSRERRREALEAMAKAAGVRSELARAIKRVRPVKGSVESKTSPLENAPQPAQAGPAESTMV